MKRRLTISLLAGLLLSSLALIVPQQAQAHHGHGDWDRGWRGGWHDNGRHLGWYRHNGWGRIDRDYSSPYYGRYYGGTWMDRVFDGRSRYPVYSRYRY